MPRETGSQGAAGYILTWVLVLTAFGALVAVGLLEYASAAFRGQAKLHDSMLERHAAEASLNRVIADLIRGADAIDTTYELVQPHVGGQPYSTFTYSTTYTPPSITVNNITPTVTITQPASAVVPTGIQQYFDPGVDNPDFATVPVGTSYVLRLFYVQAGTLVVNWSYSPAGVSRLGVWEGILVDNSTGQPFPPGRISGWPQETPILDSGMSRGNATYNRTATLSVAGGIYSIVFNNVSGGTKTSAAHAPSGGTGDTWVYVKAYRDYNVSVAANDTTVEAYVRQIPGYSQPPNTTWSSSNVSWIANSIYNRSFDRP